jgi:hypothetical protein
MFSQFAPRKDPRVVLGFGAALAVVVGSMLCVPALAGNDYGRDAIDFDYAEVVNVEPNTRQVRISVPHQFGGGRSHGVGTVAGAVIGSALGHDAAQRQGEERGYRDNRSMRAIDSQRCETRYDGRYESRVDSYRVSYQYHGRVYQTVLPRDPGQQLRVRVAVTPAE